MISDEMKSYLSNIEEYVFDEKKIVTCSWLSKTLGIHTNLSKQLLHTFLENNPKKEEICATHLLIGYPPGEESCKVLIVKDKDLEDVEKTLKKITSKHVYSVQKCLDLTDVNVLYAAQKEEFDTISKGISAIEFNCNERDDTLIAKLRFNSLPVIPNQTKITKKVEPQPAIKAKSPIKNVKNEKSPEKKEVADDKSDKKGSVIPSMFKNNATTKKKPADKVINKKPQGIGAFFSKATSKPAPVKVESKVSNEDKKEEKEPDCKLKERLSPLKENKATLNICNVNKNSPKAIDVPQETSVKPKNINNKTKGATKKTESKRGKKSSTKKNEKETKKRKRLVVLSDSESNNSSEDEAEAIREPTPEPEPTPVPADVMDDDDDIICGTPEPTRKRKKKLVSKTFVSSEGYMVTEKEYVVASCSEDEEAVPEKRFKESTSQDDTLAKASTITSATKEVKPQKAKKESPKTKNSSPQKIKQASLMSFFKKK